MYTDSKIVLGYINNEHRRFYVYVANRIDVIRQFTKPSQWMYIPSRDNPADIATRFIQAHEIGQSKWLQGPSDIEKQNDREQDYTLIDPEEDKEVRPDILTRKTVSETKPVVTCNSIGTKLFERFSTWTSLVRAIARLKHIITYDNKNGSKMSPLNSEELRNAELFIIKHVQFECFSKEITALKEGRTVSLGSAISSLSPILDVYGVLCVGGRLRQGRNISKDTNPIHIPKRHHIAVLLVKYYHESVHHQGRHITGGKIRLSDYWIVGGKRLVSSCVHNCVICKKLRGRFGIQIMSDLPKDRIEVTPPFTFVGVDTFGPWVVITKRTRGGQVNNKRWANLFTCLVSRAIPIEVIESLSSSSFINAMRRFIAIRGPVRQFRSGTNFVGATAELGMNAIYVEDETVRKFLNSNQVTWVFNPPHASHFGGVWERMIGVSRKILDAMLLRTDRKGLTHEVLTTFMSEVCSIVNSRPLCPISTDPSDPSVLTPNSLLTQETIPTLDTKDVYRSQWKHVQVLAQEFWKKWREQYLSNLQSRRKWTEPYEKISEGDIVLLKGRENNRIEWPMAIVESIFPSSDERVRKVQIHTAKDEAFCETYL